MSETSHMRQACPICGGLDAQLLLQKNGFEIVRCHTCRAQQVAPLPTREQLFAHYQSPSYFHGEESQGYANYGAMHRALRPHFLRRLKILRAHDPVGGRLLDFGCADGYFLKLARDAGWQVAGVELSRDMAREAETELGLTIPSTLRDLAPVEFDVITLCEVIEHLPDPLEQLRALQQYLRPGGVLMLSTPNTGHWQAIQEPLQWSSYRPPSHLWFFTHDTLSRVLKDAGFDRVAISGVQPVPRLPAWLDRLSAPLQHALATGQARWWPLARLSWAAIRMAGWIWQRLTRPREDVFMTLEAVAFRASRSTRGDGDREAARPAPSPPS